MEIYTPGALQLTASVLSIGAFDGIHRGHQALLIKAKESAEKLGVPFVVYTFDPPPKVFLKGCKQLIPIEEKLQRLKLLGADYVIVGPFDEAFTNKEVSDFILELKDINPVEIWEGPNFLFGKNRKGTIEVLRRFYKVEVVNPLIYEQGEMVSSTKIRNLLMQGNFSQAAMLLGEERFATSILGNFHSKS